MRSHLDGNDPHHLQQGQPPLRRTVIDTRELRDGMEGIHEGAHGDIVSASQVARRVGGTQGNLVDDNPYENVSDAGRRMYNARGLPSGNGWRGSEEVWSTRELPTNTHDGRGFSGSQTQISVGELAAHESQQGTVQRGLSPGVYKRADGQYLVVLPDGRQQILSEAQYNQWRANLQRAHQEEQRLLGQSRPKAGLVSRLRSMLNK